MAKLWLAGIILAINILAFIFFRKITLIYAVITGVIAFIVLIAQNPDNLDFKNLSIYGTCMLLFGWLMIPYMSITYLLGDGDGE